MFTAVLASIRQKHPGWQLTIRAANASAWTLRAPAGALPIEKQLSFANCDRIIRIDWHTNRSAYAEYPSTPTTQCLLEELGIRPRLLNLYYTHQPEPELLAKRDRWLREHGLLPANSIGRGRFVLIDLPANSWLKEASTALQSMVKEHGIVPIWLTRPGVADGGDWQILLDKERESMNSAELAALIYHSKGVIASDGLPLYLAAATNTPAVGLWRDAHPVQEMDLSEYVIHLVPKHHRELLNGRAAEDVFARQYRHRIYDDVESILATLRDWLASELPRAQALCHHKSS